MRKLVIALLVLIIVVAALLGWALYNIDSLIASNKDRIIAAAERHTGRKIAFERMSVKLLGGIGVRIQDVSIAEDPAFGAGHFLRAADVRVNLAIHPLRREVSVTRVALQRPVIQVIRNPQGIYNFSGLRARSVAGRRPGRPEGRLGVAWASDPPSGDAQSWAGGIPWVDVRLAVARVEVSEGRLDYHDRKDPRRVRLAEWDLRVDDLRTDRPFKAVLAAAFLSDRQNLRFDGLVGPLEQAQGADAVPVDGSVDVEALSWDGLRRIFPRIDKAWPEALGLKGTLQTRGLALKGSFTELRVAGTVDLTDSELTYGGVLNKPRGTTLRLQADVRVTPQDIVAKRFEVTWDDLAVKGRGDVDLGSPAALDLSLETAGAEVGGLHRWAPSLSDHALSGRAAARVVVTGELGGGAVPRIHGAVTLENASARVPGLAAPLEEVSAAVEFSNHAATFRQLSFRIGRTRLAGKVALESRAPLTVSYRLASPSLRLADLGLQPDDAVLEDARGSGRLTWPGGVSWEGSLTSARGTLLGLDVTDLTARLGVAGSRLAVESLRLKTLGGAVEGNGGMELGGESPRFEVTARLRGIDVRQYLSGATRFRDIEGALDADVSATGRGRTWAAIRPTLAGTGRAALVEGRMLKFNLAERALRGLAGIQGLTSLFSGNIKDKYPHIFKEETTRFEQVDTEVKASAGRVVVEHVTLKARDYGIAGTGWVDLEGDTDLDGLLTVSEGLSADLLPGSRLTPLTNPKGQLEVPFTIRGTIPDVRLRPGLKLIQSILEKSVGRGVQGLLDLIPGRPEAGKGSGKDQEAARDPIRELIERARKLFGGGR